MPDRELRQELHAAKQALRIAQDEYARAETALITAKRRYERASASFLRNALRWAQVTN